MTDKFTPKIIHFPGTALTPETVLHRTLTKLDHIKSVAVVIQWNDSSFDVDYSSTSVAELCMAGRVFDRCIEKVIYEED